MQRQQERVIMTWNFLLPAKIWLHIWKATVCIYSFKKLQTVLASYVSIWLFFFFGNIRIHYLPPLCVCVTRYLCVLRWYLRWAGQVNVLQQPSNEQRRSCLERGRPVRGGLSPSAVWLCVWSPRQPEEESEQGCAEKQFQECQTAGPWSMAVYKIIIQSWLRPADQLQKTTWSWM